MKMEYNRTFSRPPSDKTDRAWASLFPSMQIATLDITIAHIHTYPSPVPH